MLHSKTAPRTLILACGALVRELRAVLAPLQIVQDSIEVDYLPAPLHNRPEKITPAISERLTGAETRYDNIILGYGDCGTGGHLDAYIQRWNQQFPDAAISRIPGDHCYGFFTGLADFAALHEEELGTLFLTDFFARHFDLLIWQGLGIEQHPELRVLYFGNYTRVVYIAQTHDPELARLAEQAARRLGLDYEFRYTGLKPFESEILTLVGQPLNAPL